ncbi:DinB family protein [Acidicapsa dinghuensis]|uniref:DinB family protein n=1 Tax=Acidicapsa dinghuensis TaxID=2218256 RepID=A0ABW1EJ81_9BACT|nr:DinB family protein [Acidicapsa dinghuensis]
MTELARALNGNSAFASPANVLEAIPDSIAHAKPAGSPRSIYEEVWHLAFWQDISIEWVQGNPVPHPEHAGAGFPSDTAEPWDQVRSRFLTGAVKAAAIADDVINLDHIVHCPTNPQRRAPDMTIREQLESLASHNAYHLGRIVLLRQLFNNWPPPSGGDTW